MASKKRKRNKQRNQMIMLLSILFLVILGIVLIAQIKKQGTDDTVVSQRETEETGTEGNGISAGAALSDEISETASAENESDANGSGATGTDETAEDGTDESDAQEDEGEYPSKNKMNEDGVTWTTFDGYTMGSVNGGTYGTIYTEEQIRALDGSKKGFGQGVEVDDKNRPVGAEWLQSDYEKYGAIFIGEESEPGQEYIYLTSDEGYENGQTPMILDKLKDKDCRIVFFMTMEFAKGNPDLVQRMLDEGHILANHSVNHKSMPTLSLEEASNEITELHNYILENYGYEMYLFRPPMGEFSEQTLALAQSLGYRSVFWSFAYRDYDTENQPDPTEALDKISKAKHDGAIYLLHAVSSTNAQIWDKVIDDFRDGGFEIRAIPR